MNSILTDFKKRRRNKEFHNKMLNKNRYNDFSQYLQKSQPKDDLMNEELQPYIDAVLSQKKGPWSTRVAALLIRCKLEASHKRTVERAMLQCETIVNDKSGVTNTSR